MTPAIHAVGYVRRSSDSETQTESIIEQRTAIQKFADERGYKIVRWYEDDAVSGDDTEKRLGFLQMVDDARQRGDFKAIICWDQKRFGRFDTWEAGYYIHPLRKLGVYLVLVNGGVVDWDDPNSRIIYGVNQEGAHKDLRDHSANVARGQLGAMKAGGWVGSPPYAYRIEGPRKGKRLLLGDPVEVRVVQRIFTEFVEQRSSMRAIAERLNAEGFIAPNGKVKGWRWDTVRIILENPAYTGDYIAGRYAYGKYHQIKGDRVEKVNGGKRGEKPAAEWIIHRDHHQSIISRETYERAQAIFAESKGTGRASYSRDHLPPFAGLLRCSKCGCGMWVVPKRKNHQYYECGHRQYSEGMGKADCPGTTIREDVLLESLADHLESWLGDDGMAVGEAAFYGELTDDAELPKAFEEIKRLISPPAKPKKDREKVHKQAEKLKADVAKAQSNLVLLDAENIPPAQERIRQMSDELKLLERDLEQTKPVPEKDINAVALEVVRSLTTLAYACRLMTKAGYVDPDRGWRGVDNGDGTVTYGNAQKHAPKNLAHLLSRCGQIIVHTRVHGSGKGTRHEFVKGEITFRVGAERLVRELPTNLKVSRALPDFPPLHILFGPRAA